MYTSDHNNGLRKQIKNDWIELWQTIYNDKKNAEGISRKKYSLLFVEEGQVVKAARDCNHPELFEIIEKHSICDRNQRITDPKIGGWRKFAKDNFSKSNNHNFKPEIKVDCNQQKRKGGLGWKNKHRY